MITVDDFAKVDMRVGKVIHVEDFERARNPSYRVKVDFGPEIGVKWSSVGAQREYTREELLGRQVIAVVNSPPRTLRGSCRRFSCSVFLWKTEVFRYWSRAAAPPGLAAACTEGCRMISSYGIICSSHRPVPQGGRGMMHTAIVNIWR